MLIIFKISINFSSGLANALYYSTGLPIEPPV